MSILQAPKSFAFRLFMKAMDHNIEQIRVAAQKAANAHATQNVDLVDLGCWDGVTTLRYAPAGINLHGVEVFPDAAIEAKSRGIEVTQGNLNEVLPYDSNTFDIATSNQVIEHLADTDRFVAETFRILKPGGTAIVSTENMSSWHNIGALLFGWQAFSLTNISSESSGVGNPVAMLREEEPADKGWQHLRIFSYRGLKELFEVHGFKNVHVLGAGYYPLPTRVANIDPRHSAFITVVGTKPS